MGMAEVKVERVPIITNQQLYLLAQQKITLYRLDDLYDFKEYLVGENKQFKVDILASEGASGKQRPKIVHDKRIQKEMILAAIKGVDDLIAKYRNLFGYIDDTLNQGREKLYEQQTIETEFEERYKYIFGESIQEEVPIIRGAKEQDNGGFGEDT
jgi:hypothetical protein